ncbi:MAG TPA: excinuclease ABC subunit UvrB [Dehalococcoidia bacterium]|nr:excinuclease ABC subunit UvrB [Dehalococcoidia bacterium]
MGTFFHPITLFRADGAPETFDALVDTGSSFSTVPAPVLSRLGVKPFAKVRLRLATGEAVMRDIGEVRATFDGQEPRTIICVFGDPDAPALIGAQALENFMLGVDPDQKRLVPLEGWWATSAAPAEKPFVVASDFALTGDQPQAVDRIESGLRQGFKHQTLLGVTGSGKTFTMANVIARNQKPTLVISPNKTLAAQLYAEFRDFFPENAVEYFVSYYDYYQPEAYIPRTDTYIAKDADINEEIDKLRHAATRALFERRDVVIVASVSCIYGLGEPSEYYNFVLHFKVGETANRARALRRLVDMQYERNDQNITRGRFRLRGDSLTVLPAYEELAVRIDFFGDEVERILQLDPLTGEVLSEMDAVDIYPAKHFVTSADKLDQAIEDIEAELEERHAILLERGKLLEAQRLVERTRYDIECLREQGYCSGIENYSRHLARRAAGSTPWTLIDYFPDDFLMIIDESHQTIPQVRAMFHGDIRRKQTLVDFGFRLPSAIDNRPLNFQEFLEHINQVIYVSATPGPWEQEMSEQVVEQIIRPTGLVDPEVEVRPTKGQVDDLLAEIRIRAERGERTLVTTLTKKMAEDLADYLVEMGVKTHYLHSEIQTFERVEILRDLRLGVYDVIVGINLLREGLDLPEVSLVAILDADKEGYLRSEWSLIQTMGRAARNVNGRVIMYADVMTDSMRRAIGEVERRRKIQESYNAEHGIEPEGIRKAVRDITDRVRQVAEEKPEYKTGDIPKDEIARLIKDFEKQMKDAARNLEFEKAALLRDRVVELRRELVGDDEGLEIISSMRRGDAAGPRPRLRQGRTRPRK